VTQFWPMFYLFNGPYVVVPVLAAIWLIAQPGKPSRAGTSTSA
jgi:hypothetical protein